MTTAAHVQGFLPSINGLHFDNGWPSEPDITIPTPFGNLNIGDASMGLCGGMTYTVRDFFEESLPIPLDATNPALHTPLYDYIVRRLFDSFDIPVGVAAYIAWDGYGAQVQYRNTVTWEWPKIKTLVDAGTLAPLALIHVTEDLNPGDMGKNHQVLVYAYSEDASGLVTVHLYDPNHHDHDDVTLMFGTANPDGAPDISFHVGGTRGAGGEVTFGCFVTAYTHVAPAAALTLDTPRVVYRAVDNTVQELSLPLGGNWAAGQPAQPHGPAASVGNPMGYVSALDHTCRVVYRDGAGHVQELSLPPAGAWSPGDLTALSGAAVAASDPWAYTSPSARAPSVIHAPTETPRVLYSDAGGHIWEIELPIGGSWSAADLTVASGAPPAAGAATGYLDPSDNSPRVVYRGVDGHIIEIRLALSNFWEWNDLSGQATAPGAAGDPWCYVSPLEDTLRVVFRGTDAHVHELSVPPGGVWSVGDLTLAGGTADAVGDPHGYVTLRDLTSRVVYRDGAGHVSELSLAPGGGWVGGDLTALAHGADAVGDPFGYTSYLDHTARVVYRDGAGHVRELSLAPGAGWADGDLTALAGGPAAAGDPRGYIG